LGIGLKQLRNQYGHGFADAERFKSFGFNLPSQINGWTRVESVPAQTQKLETAGVYVNKCLYRKGSLLVSVGIDFPFPGYHDLRTCYQVVDWQFTRETVKGYEGEEGLPREEISMELAGHTFGSLMFAVCDEKASWLERPDSMKATALKRWRDYAGVQPPTFQVQTLAVSNAPLTADQLSEEREFFKEIQKQFARYVMARAKGKP
jgi:hypothetical protein